MCLQTLQARPAGAAQTEKLAQSENRAHLKFALFKKWIPCRAGKSMHRWCARFGVSLMFVMDMREPKE